MITLIYSYLKIYEKENYDNKMPYVSAEIYLHFKYGWSLCWSPFHI